VAIPIFLPPKPDLNAILQYLEEASSLDQYSNYGALYKQFRKRVAAHVGLDPESVVLVSNATVALEAAISTYIPHKAATQEFQSVWTLPSWSFAATGLAAKRANVRFQFGDVTQDKGILDFTPLQSSAYSIGVAPFGSSIEDSVFAGFTLIDAAASFDSLKSAAPHMSDFTGVVLSFHATKTLSSGEGGAFISKDKAWAERVRAYTSFGFPQGSRSSEGSGTNGKMSEVTAAFGLASLDQWPKTRQEWNVSTQTALEISKRHAIQVAGALNQGFISPYWVLKLDSASETERLELLLAQAGVETRRWWERGMHRMPAFSEVPIAGPLLSTESWAETTIGLPLHTRLTGSDFSTIDKVLQSFARRR
jgi:dTDP-4-amino-4,6-dideoxygalactose transaminase